MLRGIPFDYSRAFLFNADGGSGGSGDGGQGGEGSGGAGDGGQSNDSKTFTQADLDRIVQDRIARERAKYADYDDLKGKATRFDELEAANKSELDKAKERAEAAEKKAADTESKARDILVRAEITAAAAKAGAVDPADVYALLDKTKVTVGDDGSVTGAEDAVKALLESKPHLVGKQSKFSGGADGGARGGDLPSQLSRDDLKTMTPEQIVKARQEGRLKGLLGG